MITVAILTISDSAAAGTRADLSGPGLKAHCETLGWAVNASHVVADEETEIAQTLEQWSEQGLAAVILTTGGTGLSPRDNTPQATRRILDREVPGIAELIRSKGMAQTPLSVLSRGIAGTRKRSLIINLPGSPRGCLFSLEAVQHLIPHAVDLLSGHTDH